MHIFKNKIKTSVHEHYIDGRAIAKKKGID